MRSLFRAKLQSINKDTGNDDQIADQLSTGDLFFQDDPGEQKHEHVCGSVNNRTIAHVDFGITPGIQKKNAEKEHIGKDNTPVQVLLQGIAVFDVCTLLEKDLGDSREKGPSQHDKDKCSIHIFVPSILRIIRSGSR